MSPPLSRTSSTTSVSSIDDSMLPSDNNTTPTASRRTRKRFTNVQLIMLENLFHRNSHPSREEREAVATSGGMEVKSVTIWFQNKRQTERKVALQSATPISTPPNNASLCVPVNRRVNHQTISPFTSPNTSSSASSSRPTLDHVASRTESRFSASQRTPTSRRHQHSSTSNNNDSLWDHMPSSPLASPASPSPQDYLEFSKPVPPRPPRPTLEWACAAAARITDSGRSSPIHRSHSRKTLEEKDVLDLTDDETEEAITPPSTWGKDDPRWSVSAQLGAKHIPVNLPEDITIINQSPMNNPLGDLPQDEDMMRAALALCGLGRRK